MLLTLSITNFAIIDRLEVEFGPGFNVLTGETGAGKSIVMDALGLLLGDRANPELIRAGCEEATVEALFDLAGRDDLQTVVTDAGFPAGDDLILRRREAMGISVVVVTHDVESAFKIGDRITVLDRGRVLACEPPEQIKVNPNERVQNLINRRSEHVEVDPEEYLRRLAGD